MNLNSVHIIGRVTKQPELRETPSGMTICSFSVATNHYRKDKTEEVEFHNITTFSFLAERIAKYVTKGQEVFVEGRMKTESWTSKDGQKRYKTGVIAERVEFGARVGGAAGAGGNVGATPNPANDLSDMKDIEDEISIEDLPF